MNIKALTGILMGIHRNATRNPHLFRKAHPIMTSVILSLFVLPGYLLLLLSGASPAYAGQINHDNLCPRLSQAPQPDDFNQIIDCMESHIKGLNARLNAAQGMESATGAVESSGLRFLVRSARLVTQNKKTRLQVVLSITNISKSKVSVVFIRPEPTADDNDGQLFLIEHNSAIKGIVSCAFETESFCARHTGVRNFTPLQPGISVNAHLSFSPDSTDEENISSKLASITVTFLIYKGTDYEQESVDNAKNYESVSVTIRGVRVKKPAQQPS